MSVSVCRRLRGLAATVVVSAVALGAFPALSAASTAAGLCDSAPLRQAFLPWGDTNLYKLAPGGDFEGSLAGWSLTGSATRVAGSEPGAASGKLGASSLGLPAGASAQSPATCVTAAYPSFRFFSRSDTPGSVVSVSVVYQTALGTVAIPVGAVSAGRPWTPSAPLPTLSAVAGLFTGGAVQVGLRFTAVKGSSQIDDVFIDPHTMH